MFQLWASRELVKNNTSIFLCQTKLILVCCCCENFKKYIIFILIFSDLSILCICIFQFLRLFIYGYFNSRLHVYLPILRNALSFSLSVLMKLGSSFVDMVHKTASGPRRDAETAMHWASSTQRIRHRPIKRQVLRLVFKWTLSRWKYLTPPLFFKMQTKKFKSQK